MKRIILLAVLFALMLPLASADKKVLRMVTSASFPPYEFYEGQTIIGIDADIMREIAKRNGFELVIEDMKFDSVIAAIQTGKGDVAASAITITEDRKKTVNFTIPYVTAMQVIIVRQDSTVADDADLKNKRIGVQHGTTGDTYVTKNIGEPQRFIENSTAIAALLAGKLDAVVLDADPAKVHVAKNSGLKILKKPLTCEEYALAVAKNQQDLLSMLNKTLSGMIDDGAVDAIIRKYAKKNTAVIAEHTEALEADEGLWGEVKLNFVKNQRWRYLLDGFVITMQVSLASVVLGIVIGFLIAVIRCTADQTGKLKIANLFCHVYLTVIRGTPVVLQLLIIYFVVFGSVDVDKVLVAIIAFGINSGAYVAEIIRSGIMSIDRGQMEAGRSLGLSYTQSMRLVILPQALKNVLPALGNEFIVLLKETSVCGFIALQDLTKGGDVIRSQTYNAFLPLIAVAVIYLLLVMIFSKALQVFEKRLKKNE